MATVVLAAALFLAPGSPADASGMRPDAVEDRRGSVAGAARENRIRIRESRRERGAAPRFTDADLVGLHRPGPRRAALPPANRRTEPPADAAAASVPTVGEDAAGADDTDRVPEAGPTEDAGEREAALRERLLDIEASLAAIGASGLPFAPRNPNRFQGPLDAPRLRAEQEELRRELAELTGRRRTRQR